MHILAENSNNSYTRKARLMYNADDCFQEV